MRRFTVDSIERKSVYGTESYILRGCDEQGRPEVFNVPYEGFPRCEEILERIPGTTIKRTFNEAGRLVGIKIEQLAPKVGNQNRKKRVRMW